MDGWIDVLRLYDLFNSISVISERWLGDDKRLCATESRLLLETDFRNQRGSNLGRTGQ